MTAAALPDLAGAWLLVIDMQRIFAEPDSPWATPDFAAAQQGVDRLLPAFAGRTAFTRFVAPAHPAGAWADYYRDWPFALDPAHADQYALVDGYARHGEPVIDRSGFGKWDATTAARLDRPGTIVLAGVSTDCCVLSTALAAVDDGVRIVVAADACAGLSAADHQRALDAMALFAPNVAIADTGRVLQAV